MTELGHQGMSARSDEEREELLREIIKGLEKQRGVKAWAVVSQEGLVVDQRIPDGVNPYLLAGNTAALAHSAQSLVDQARAGAMNTLILETERYILLLTGGGSRLLFLVMADHESDIQELVQYLTEASRHLHTVTLPSS